MKHDWAQARQELVPKSDHYGRKNYTEHFRQNNRVDSDRAPASSSSQDTPSEWADVELSISYGYMARERAGAMPTPWSDEVDSSLRQEWDSGDIRPEWSWDDVRIYARHGYEHTRKS